MTTPHPPADAPVSAQLTAVVPHYGDPAPTVRLVRTLVRQRDAAGLRVIVGDDASPQPFDLPADLASENVEVLRRAVNGGFGANVNSCLDRVRTDYAIVLNSDLELDHSVVADWWRAARPWLPAVVAPRVVDGHGSPQWVGRHFPTIGHQTVEWLTPLARWRHTRALHEAVGHDTRAETSADTSVDWVMGAAMLLPVSEVRAVGGFREDFFMNAEEVDLQRRLRARGIPSVVVGAVTVRHEGGGSSDPLRRRTWLVDARATYARTWGHPRTLKAALTAATGINAVVNTARRLAGRPVHPLTTARQELALIHPRLRSTRSTARARSTGPAPAVAPARSTGPAPSTGPALSAQAGHLRTEEAP